jgi:dienelactone hydrolase
MVGYSFDEQSPYAQIKDNQIPVLLILAGKETTIPGESIAQIRQILQDAPGECTVYTEPDATHADVWLADPEEYEKQIEEFLN